MKRNKFVKRINALLIAAAITGSTLAIPVHTYAASNNRVTTTVSVAKGTELTDNAPSLILELKDDLDVGDTFYLELKNAEWLMDDVTVEASNIGGTATFDVEAVDKDVIAVTLSKVLNEDGATEETVLPADALIRVKLASVIKKASASVIIDSEGTVITANSSGIEYAKVHTDGASAKISEVKSFTTGGVLGDLTIEEAYEGAFVSELDRNGNLTITLKLDNSDVEFLSAKKVSVTGIKGLAGVSADVELVEDDEILITVDGEEIKGLEKGGFKISGLSIATIDDEAISGTVSIDIESDSFKTMSVQVAKFVKDSLDVKVTPYSSDNKDGLIAGRSGEYKIEIKESSEETLLDGKRLDFTLTEGYFMDAGTTNSKTALGMLERNISLPGEMELEAVTLDDTKITGFSVTVTAEDDEIDEFTLKVPAAIGLEVLEDLIFEETAVEDADSVAFGSGDGTALISNKDKKVTPTVKLTVAGRAISGEEIEVDLAKVLQPVTVELEEKVYKVGLKDQEGTDIIIKEEKAGRIDKGTIVIAFDDAEGLSFSQTPTVEVTKGDLKLGKGELIRSGNAITGIKFNVSRASRSASEITIKDVVVTADRTVPEGRVGILLGGSALTNGNPIASKTYAKLVDANLTDSNTQITDSLQQQIDNIQQIITQKESPVTAVFTMGSTGYTVNGEAKQMDGTPYVSENGRTMIPVRYVADALGVDSSKILSNSGVITILANETTVQFKLNSNVMLKDGAQIPMDEKAVLKDGRTYIPVSFAASALGVSASYDATTKTVTFQNKAALSGKPVTLPLATTNTTETPVEDTTTDASDLFDILSDLQ